MTVVACVAVGGVILLLLAREREARREREAWEAERRELLTRIQRPELVPVEPGEIVAHEVPQDAAELAQVGLVVPEFVNVGGQDG